MGKSTVEFLVPKLGMRQVINTAGNPALKPAVIKMAIDIFGLDKELKSNAKMVKLILNHFNACFNAKKERNKLAWVHPQPQCEILSAFDILSFMPAPFATVCAWSGISTKALERAERYGFSRDSCAFNRHTVGAYLLKDIPQPDILISTMPFSCDAEGKSFEAINYFTGVPVHQINTPFRSDTSEAVEFLKEELLRLIEILEKFTGRELDYEKLKNIIKE